MNFKLNILVFKFSDQDTGINFATSDYNKLRNRMSNRESHSYWRSIYSNGILVSFEKNTNTGYWELKAVNNPVGTLFITESKIVVKNFQSMINKPANS